MADDGLIGMALYDDCHDPKYGDPVKVPIRLASADSLKGYGTIVTDFDKSEVEITVWPKKGWRPICQGTGNQGGIISGDYECHWRDDVIIARDTAIPGDDFIIGRAPLKQDPRKHTHVLVREANYHPDGGQVFFPANNNPFVALLALPGDDIKPEDFVAFYFDGTFGVHIHANIWHQAIYPVHDMYSAAIKGKQGRVHACVDVDTVKEFGKYLLVPLTLDG